MFPNKRLCGHRKVVQGEIRGELINRPCVIKFDSQQIENEIKALSKLSGRSYIINLIESGSFGDMFESIPYIILEKYHHLNLEQYANSNKTEPLYDVNGRLRYCKQIIEGIKHVHEKFIIHKDLKPSNILLSLDLETVAIADFGSSEIVKSSLSKVRSHSIFGTLGYRPPESLERTFVSLKSDIFSLGVIFHFLLTNGRSPFGEESDKWDHNTQNGVLAICDLLVPNPKATKHLITSMVKKERRARPNIEVVSRHRCWNGTEKDSDYEFSCMSESEIEDTDSDAIEERPYDGGEANVNKVDEDEFLKAMNSIPGIDKILNPETGSTSFESENTTSNQGMLRNEHLEETSSTSVESENTTSNQGMLRNEHLEDKGSTFVESENTTSNQGILRNEHLEDDSNGRWKKFPVQFRNNAVQRRRFSISTEHVNAIDPEEYHEMVVKLAYHLQDLHDYSGEIQMTNPFEDPQRMDFHRWYSQSINPEGIGVLFLGLGHGLHDMAEDRVPFGNFDVADNFWGISAAMYIRSLRVDVSARCFWNLMTQICGTLRIYSKNCFTQTLCPLLYKNGMRNVTPFSVDFGPLYLQRRIASLCDEFLIQSIELLRPDIIVAIGKTVMERAERSCRVLMRRGSVTPPKLVRIQSLSRVNNFRSEEIWQERAYEVLFNEGVVQIMRA